MAAKLALPYPCKTGTSIDRYLVLLVKRGKFLGW